MKDFGDEFDMLLACELPHARRDAARMADLISKLAEGLGLVLAIAGAKRPEGPAVLVDATANRVIEAAAEQAPLAHRIVGAR